MAVKTKNARDECTSEASRKRLLRAVALSERLLLRRLERAVLHEEEIDALLSAVDEAAREEGMNEKSRKELLAGVSGLKCEDLSKLVSIIGVLADKESEMRGERAARDATDAEERRFEEM